MYGAPVARVSTRRGVTMARARRDRGGEPGATGEGSPARQGRGARRDRGGEPGAPSNGTGAARGNPICARWRAGVRVCAGAGMGGRGRGYGRAWARVRAGVGAGACGRAGVCVGVRAGAPERIKN